VDSIRIEALADRCLRCTQLLADRQRVLPCYHTGPLLAGAQQLHEVGLFVGADTRPRWLHVRCDDPQLRTYAMQPTLELCARCKGRLDTSHMIQPVYQVTGRGVNPNDPTDTGLFIGDRIHFVHIDCGDPTLKSSSLLVVQ